MEKSVKEEILYLTELIEGYTETWDTHDSLADFETFEVIYARLCRLVGKEPKNLRELQAGAEDE